MLLKERLMWMSLVLGYSSITETFLTKSFYFLSCDGFLIIWVISNLTMLKMHRAFTAQSVTARKLQNILPDFCISLIIWREITRSHWTVNIACLPNWIFADEQKRMMGREQVDLWNEISCRSKERRPPIAWYEMRTPLC